MKTKTNQKPKLKLQPNSQEGKSGFPDPIKTKCFECKKTFWIKFVVPQRDYSKKNNWGYWTENEKDQNRKICNFCLRSFYLDHRKEFLATVKDLKKRNNLRSYISDDFV